MPRKGKNKRKGNRQSLQSANSETRLDNQSQLGGTPDRQRVTLRYTTLISRSPSGVAAADYVFTGNGLFDCDITSTGGQPANYDDYSALYGRYRCYGSSIMVRAVSSQDEAKGGCLTVVGARHTTTALSTLTAVLDAASQPMTINSVWTGESLKGKEGVTFRMKKSTMQVLGYKKMAIDTDDTLQALTSANPNHQFYWHIATAVVDQTSSVACYFYVQIDYDVEFFDRLDTLIDFKVMRVPKTLAGVVSQLVQERSERGVDDKKSTSSGGDSDSPVLISRPVTGSHGEGPGFANPNLCVCGSRYTKHRGKEICLECLLGGR
jgi:hypothetical protein